MYCFTFYGTDGEPVYHEPHSHSRPIAARSLCSLGGLVKYENKLPDKEPSTELMSDAMKVKAIVRHKTPAIRQSAFRDASSK